MNAADPTQVACLTPPGRAALATLGVRGPRAWEIVRRLLRPRSKTVKLPEHPEPGAFWLGRLGGELADEVVVAVENAGTELSIEVHCHGGPEVVRLLIETLSAEGAEPCSWQHFARALIGPGTRVGATAALANSLTVRTASILLDQANGALDRAMQKIRAALQQGTAADATTVLDELARFISLGRRLTQPWKVAVVGAPNVGKSSLVNALAGYERCIVSATPGTTRDAVTTLIAVDGWPVELIDTAGLHETKDELERSGIERASRAARDADLCLWVVDGSAPPIWPHAPNELLRFVVSKTDLPAAWDWKSAPNALAVSAKTGTGLEQLITAMAQWLVPAVPLAGAAVPFTDELCSGVFAARELLHSDNTGDALDLLQRLWETGGWPTLADSA